MSETDALSKFDFSKVTGGGLYLKFKAGEPVTLRVLTVDPIVSTEEYRNPDTDEVESVSTKFSFVVYNFTEGKAQILKATPTIAKEIGRLHTDSVFGANIRKIDIRITPTGEKLLRRYAVDVLPNANTLTRAQVEECKAINLDEKVEGDRMSFYEKPSDGTATRSLGDEYRAKTTEPTEDTVVEDIGDEPINLNDIPF